MTDPLNPVKPEDYITDPETGEQLKILTRTRPETWMDKLLREQGIKVQEVEPPKNFCRVVFPVNPKPVTDKKEE
jgi:hypothetical protein